MTEVAKTLTVLLEGRHAGDLTQDAYDQLAFTYHDEYRHDASATPLSLAMPLVRAEHENTVVDTFLRGLLPDSEFVLQRWGIRFGVSANSPFALLTHVGEDVAGAAQFVRPDRLENATAPGTLHWVDEAYIANRLRILRGDRAAWDDAASPGQFSLAGAQSKFALYRSPDERWHCRPVVGRRRTYSNRPWNTWHIKKSTSIYAYALPPCSGCAPRAPKC